MADDFFPILTINIPAPFVGGVGVGAIDLRSLGEELTPHLRDPFVETVDGAATRPPAAAQTTGPHRYTIVVPNQGESSVLNVGQGDTRTANRNKDTGITGRTKSHVHFHAEDGPKTTLLLGGPTLHGWTGPNGADNPAANRGFMVVTEGKAWQESAGHQVLMSKGADAVLRSAGDGKRVVIQADKGEVDLIAKKKIYAAASGITLMAPSEVAPKTDKNYDGAWTDEMPKTEAGKGLKSAVTVAGGVATVIDLIKKGPKIWSKLKPGKFQWESESTDIAKFLLDAGKLVLDSVELVQEWTSTAPSPGAVKIGADSKVSILAGDKVSVSGGLRLSQSASVWASMSAGLSASVKGTVWAGIGSMYTSLKGYRKVEMSSDFGKAIVKGAKSVEVSTEGDATVSAKGVAQVASDKLVALVGKQTAYVAAAPGGEGMGMHATDRSVWLGKITARADDFEAACRNFNFIEFEGEEKVAIVSKKESHAIENEVEFRSTGFKVDAKSGNVEMKGSKILLG